MELNPGENIPGSNDTKYQVIFQVKCDEDVKFQMDGKFDIRKQKNVLVFTSEEACEKLGFYNTWKFVMDNKIMVTIVLIVIGLYLMILGNRLLVITTFLVCCLFFIVFLFVFLFQYIIPSYTAPFVKYIVLGVGIAGGVGLGIYVSKRKKIMK